MGKNDANNGIITPETREKLEGMIDNVFKPRLALDDDNAFVKALKGYVAEAESSMELKLVETICLNRADTDRKRDAFATLKWLTFHLLT